MLELLAPAGVLKSFETAINCGADAIYLGLSDFNARKKAENFNADNLRDCVKKAHFFGVRVYITVNTLVRDCEMPDLISLVRTAVEANADAFIVQDLGVARCLRKAFPNIVLHASTQLGVHNLYGAKIAERIGFKRVVLSRETKLDDIRAIREGTALEIEYFVQGALCVAFSGNCYLSAVEQNASGNRGLCKQLCRLPYKATVGSDCAEGYLLSTKDLCLADSIKELAEAGVTSFKIEGRLRRDGYVGSAVNIYRQIIDGINKSAKLTARDRDELQIAYCRGDGYSERAYLDGGTPDGIIERDFNNHTGLKVGSVTAVVPFKSDLYKVTISSDYQLSKGDGLKFFEQFARISKCDSIAGGREKAGANKCGVTWKEVASLGIGDIYESGKGKCTFITKTALKVGWSVHLISHGEQNFDERNVSVKLAVKAKIGEPLTLSATAENGVSVSVFGSICERAKTSPMSAEDIANQASKTADSGFCVSHCDVETDGVFIAKSAFNALRRALFVRLSDEVISSNEKHKVEIDIKEINCINNGLKCAFDEINLRFVHSDDLKEKFAYAESSKYDGVIFALCPTEYTVHEVKRMIEILGVPYDKIALQLPVIANGKDLAVIGKLLANLSEIRTLVSENIYGFEFAQNGYKVIVGAGHNVLNGYAKAECGDLGASGVLPAIESAERSDKIGEELPLMTFAHCPYKTVYGNTCGNCSYREGMTISRERKTYRVRRTRVVSCYFGLY